MKLPKINWPALVVIAVALWFLLSGRGPNLDGLVNQLDRWFRSPVVSAGASGGSVGSPAGDPYRGWEVYYQPVTQPTPVVSQSTPSTAAPTPDARPTPTPWPTVVM